MKIKPKPIKMTLTSCFMPMFAYFGINILVSVAYVFLIAMPKLSDTISLSPPSNMAEVDIMFNEILSADSVLLMMLVNIAVLIYAVRSFVRSEGYVFDRRYENRFSVKDILMMAVTALGMFFAVNIVMTVITRLFSSMMDSMDELNTTVGAMVGEGVWLTIIVVGILAPVVEEFLVRGLIFNRLRKIGSVPFAIFTSSFIFASMHFPMVAQCVYTFAVGAVFAWAYYKYENILIPIILHILYNMCSFVFMIPQVGLMFMGLGGLLAFYFMGVGLTYFGIRFLKNKPRPEVKEEFRELVRAEELLDEYDEYDETDE
ncbi:MAG: CPBP family intramembrane metalloprotease [Eubacteriaceae bacterium]|nr:CPBP family intramembrane metalloprotease [Eubacteriaceae bacterium]